MDLSAIPHSPGVYLMRDTSGQILYIGKAGDLSKRVRSYFLDRADHSAKVAALVASIHHVDYLPTESEREALILEQGLIRKLQPHFNTMWRDDKSYPYIKLTWSEDFPRLFLTRKKVADGSKYFGPYPNVKRVRKLLRYLWKQRLFPLRPCRYEFSEKSPLPLAKAKQCLYYHTKECPAPCVGRVSKNDYRQIAKEVELFLKGNFKPLEAAWQKEMKEASQTQNYERAAQLRDNLEALKHIGERVTIRQIDLSDVTDRVDRSRAITDLQKALALKDPPIRIECFDISHFQGVETVASMVAFERGEPKKDDYRKFKIKTVRGIDDFASMGEVVGRRYRRLRDENKRLPDLVLIDGGKGQLSEAIKAILNVIPRGHWRGIHRAVKRHDGSPTTALGDDDSKHFKLPFDVAALAKREEEIFLPGREEPVRLPKDSAALHLVQHVRDEAHRFAITFHRQRRAKRFLR
jgi:excinuclease ABC subunit C